MTAPVTAERGEPLAGFVAALRAAVEDVAAPGGAAAGAAQRMLGALERPAPAGPAPDPATLDPCRHLDAALANARAGPPRVAGLAAAFGLVAPSLAWRRRAGSAEAGTAFHLGHANAWIVGPEGLEQRSDVVVGASLLAPGVTYPHHRHPPEEIYVVLSEGEWYHEDAGWYRPGLGGLVHHRPGVTHAMRAGDAPLLAVWCLWTGAVATDL